MTPRRTDASPDLFGISLAKVINLDHPLVRLTSEFDWEGIRREIEPSFCDANTDSQPSGPKVVHH